MSPDDDTYMYDDDARCSGIGPHWYDEPPYESDPEDFLMGSNAGQPVPLGAIQNGRFVYVFFDMWVEKLFRTCVRISSVPTHIHKTTD